MRDVEIIWDLPDEPDGNYRHITDGHDVTVDEVEEVLRNPDGEDVISRSSGQPAVFGWTSTGKYLFVVYEQSWTTRSRCIRSPRIQLTRTKGRRP